MIVTATDLFAGAGGSSEGMTEAGIRVELAANHWPTAVATHRLNHPETEHRTANLSNTDWRTYPSTHVLWASPSCRWQAKAGGRRQLSLEEERKRTDPGAIDRATAFAVIEAAEVHQYPVIFVENVLEFQDWVLYPWWLDGLQALGYTTEVMVLDAADFGHAQVRRRLFVAASRDGVRLDLTRPPVRRASAAEILEADPGKPVTRRLYVADQIDSIREDRVPYLVTYRKHAKARRANLYPLATVTAGGNHHAVAQVIDGVQHHRLISNRECARAQGFPDRYRFTGTGEDVKRQIGNAVPVGIARWLGVRAMKALGAA